MREAFPGCEVEVVHQNASGSIPFGCRTIADDEEGNQDDSAEATIHRIAEEVFASGVWYVEKCAEAAHECSRCGDPTQDERKYVVDSERASARAADSIHTYFSPDAPELVHLCDGCRTEADADYEY